MKTRSKKNNNTNDQPGTQLYHCVRCFEVFRCKMKRHRHVKNETNCTEKNPIRAASPKVPKHIRCLVSQINWNVTIFSDLRVGVHFQTFLVDAVILRSKEFRKPEHRRFLQKFLEFEFYLEDKTAEVQQNIGKKQEASLQIKRILQDWIFLLFLKTIVPNSDTLEEAYEHVNFSCLRIIK